MTHKKSHLASSSSRPQARQMREFYETSGAYFEMLSETSSTTQAQSLDLYVSVMKRYCGDGERVLDVGCGRGTTTSRLASEKNQVIGIDLSWNLLQGRSVAESEASWVIASADQLPFRDGTFSVIGMNSVLEHVVDVPAVLEELVRVIRTDGKLLIISPNLFTPLRPIKAVFGLDQVSASFYGSRWKALFSILTNIYRLAQRRLSPWSTFIYRDPDLARFEGPDDDATWYCNSMDIIRWFRRRGMKARRVPLPASGRSGLSRLKGWVGFFLPDLDKGFCVVAER
jgi:2-polyprenyl-3-methyl-5-hydroxy-6-metoxy-1,4-benzoquinol methylase